ncbi:MAG: AraC family transcriptional regulator [Clostridia bacterium]|nr:AraC family transcriptional regulator [Clostridia bacterium]
MSGYYDIEIMPAPLAQVRRLGEEYVDIRNASNPQIKLNVVFHYIYEGKGVFRVNNKEYHLRAGQAFVIFPNTLVHYEPDKEQPWHYRWIEIAGTGAGHLMESIGISPEEPVLWQDKADAVGGALAKMTIQLKEGATGYKITALFWDFINEIAKICDAGLPDAPARDVYVSRALNYIETYYWKQPHVNEIASFLGIDRTYFNRIFRQKVGISPREYILNHRIRIAIEFLRNSDSGIEHISKSVGYEDVHAFSKAFKKKTGMSPGTYRKQHKNGGIMS